MHRFPLITSISSDSNKTLNNSVDAFQPLFVGSPNIPESRDENEELRIQTYQDGLLKGTDAGHKEGSSLAQKSKKPDIEKFIDSYEQLNERIHQMVHTASKQAVQIAVEIVECILGPDLQLNNDALAQLTIALKSYLTDSYHTSIHMAPQDHDLLMDISQFNGMPLPSVSSGVSLSVEASILSGDIKIEQQRIESKSIIANLDSEITHSITSKLFPSD